jgi:hypothetical protein
LLNLPKSLVEGLEDVLSEAGRSNTEVALRPKYGGRCSLSLKWIASRLEEDARLMRVTVIESKRIAIDIVAQASSSTQLDCVRNYETLAMVELGSDICVTVPLPRPETVYGPNGTSSIGIVASPEDWPQRSEAWN